MRLPAGDLLEFGNAPRLRRSAFSAVSVLVAFGGWFTLGGVAGPFCSISTACGDAFDLRAACCLALVAPVGSSTAGIAAHRSGGQLIVLPIAAGLSGFFALRRAILPFKAFGSVTFVVSSVMAGSLACGRQDIRRRYHDEPGSRARRRFSRHMRRRCLNQCLPCG